MQIEQTKDSRAVRTTPSKFKWSLSKKITYTIVFTLFALYAISLIFPFVFILMNSFKTSKAFFANPLAIGFDAGFENYIKTITDPDFTEKGSNVFTMLGQSFFVTSIATFITVTMSLCAAYIMAKYKFTGREIMFSIIIISMTVPIVGTLPAQYKFMKETTGLIDTHLGIWFLYSGAFGFNFLFIYSSFKNVSWSYAEAAFIDGASHFRVFLLIMVPLIYPVLIAVCVLSFIGIWNDYQTPALYLPSFPTLAVGLNKINERVKTKSNVYTIMFAAMIIALIPILSVFIGFQKIILNNTMSGGLKG